MTKKETLENDETVPRWCSWGMESCVWIALIVTIFTSVIGWDTVVTLSAICTAGAVVFWMLHGRYLARLPFLPGYATWAAVVVVTCAMILSMVYLPGTPLVRMVFLTTCVCTFMVISCGFTESQVARYLYMLGGMAMVHALIALYMSRSGDAVADIWKVKTLFGDVWPAIAFCSLGIVALCTASVYAAREAALERRQQSMHSVVAWFTSPGIQMAVVGAAMTCFVLLFLYLLPSLYAIVISSLLVIGTTICLTARGKVPVVVLFGVVAIAVVFNVISLGRPRGEVFIFSGDVFGQNMERVRTGRDMRVYDPFDEKEELQETGGHRLTVKGSDFGRLSGSISGIVTVVVVGLGVLYLLGMSWQGMSRFEGSEAILAVGAFWGVLGIMVYMTIGECIWHPAISLSAAGFAAVAAARGAFEKEV